MTDVRNCVRSLEADLGTANEIATLPALADTGLRSCMARFVVKAAPVVQAMSAILEDLDCRLKLLATFFAQKPDETPEALFDIVASFTAQLQQAALEMASRMQKTPPSSSTRSSSALQTVLPTHEREGSTLSVESTGSDKTARDRTPRNTLSRMPLIVEPGASGVAGLEAKGGLDEAIRTVRNGVRRREREASSLGGAQAVRLSRMFWDGSTRAGPKGKLLGITPGHLRGGSTWD